jgi:hypothetical protein
MKDRDFYTPTMAKIYTRQGYLSRAAEIYRYLIRQHPERTEFVTAYEDIEKRLLEKGKEGTAALVPLFSKWIDLEFKYHRLKKLKKLQRRL